MRDDEPTSFADGDAPRDFAVLVHGGAGDLPDSAREGHAEGCARAARVARDVVAAGGAALDAAGAAVRVLEDDPRFNAGTGACLAEDGSLELDASIMEGRTLAAGAVCALPPFASPIAIARAALDDGRHVLYAGDGARRFAEKMGFAPADPATMITEAARARFLAARDRGAHEGWAGGTVGAVVALRGSVAAATSTGGRANKALGRVGDSPILGAGTYADDEAAACSTTGDGEAMMRLCVAKTAVEWARAGQDLVDVARGALRTLARRTGGSGGLILVDPRGRLAWARTTRTMSWAALATGWDEPRSGA